MGELQANLFKRRKIGMIVILLLSIISVVVDSLYGVEPIIYFDAQYNMYGVYFLLLYKFIELAILYYILMHRYLQKNDFYVESSDLFAKATKHMKLLFFLIPQGNMVFGFIAFKLSGNVLYFLTFSAIGLVTLYFININKINKCLINTHS